MTAILYTFDRAFMRKTYEAIDRHVDAESAYLALSPEASGSAKNLTEVTRDGRSVDETVAAVDPDVVVRNHRLRPGAFDFDTERTVVHIRHGASVGRGEVAVTTAELGDVVDVALAPGERWAARYREEFPDDVRVAVVGVPEADALVNSDPPRERRVLYAPTNHNYGSGSYLNTADSILDAFAGSENELLFRPHPMDRIEEPGTSVTERCRERIESLPNVTFDDSDTPRESLHQSDMLISDYSGIVTEWLHTDRPMIQLTDLAGETDPPQAGTTTDTVSIGLVEDLYENGPPVEIREKRAEFRSSLGIPMDGQAGERAAARIQVCTE